MLKRIWAALLGAAITGAVLAGCSAPPASPSTAPPLAEATPASGFTFTDDLGREVQLAGTPAKVVALLGSYGEIWLEAGGELAGITDDYEKNHTQPLPAAVQKTGSVKDPNIEVIFEIAPDFVILSPDIAAHLKIAEQLQAAGIACAFFRQESWQEYLHILDIFTRLLHTQEVYTREAEALQKQIDTVLSSLPQQDTPPKVLLVRGMASGIHALGADHPAGKILQDLGAENITDKHPSILEDLNVEYVLDENPDFILIVPMGDADTANASFWDAAAANELWQQVNALRTNHVVLLPKELYQLKPNQRWGESYEYLADILYG